MKPKTLCIEPTQLNTARRILAGQAWICSNCGLKRTFRRVSLTHKCQGTEGCKLPVWHGIWRKAELNSHIRTSILPPDPYMQITDYLIRLRTNPLVISVEELLPFSA